MSNRSPFCHSLHGVPFTEGSAEAERKHATLLGRNSIAVQPVSPSELVAPSSGGLGSLIPDEFPAEEHPDLLLIDHEVDVLSDPLMGVPSGGAEPTPIAV